MPISHDDVQELKSVFDDRYVLQSDCDETRRAISRKLSNDNTRIELLVQQQKINNWLTTAIVGGIIALLIKAYLGG